MRSICPFDLKKYITSQLFYSFFFFSKNSFLCCYYCRKSCIQSAKVLALIQFKGRAQLVTTSHTPVWSCMMRTLHLQIVFSIPFHLFPSLLCRSSSSSRSSIESVSSDIHLGRNWLPYPQSSLYQLPVLYFG